MADLHLVDEVSAGVAADDVLEVQALQPGAQGVADLVRREEDPTMAVDGDGVGELQLVGLDGVPDLGRGQLGGGRGEEQAADRHTRAKQLLPVGGIREACVVQRALDLHGQAIAVEHDRPAGQHFDADTGEGAALGEVQARQMGLEEVHFRRVAGPKGQGQGYGIAVFSGADRQDLAIGAVPELVFVHGIGKVGAGSVP